MKVLRGSTGRIVLTGILLAAGFLVVAVRLFALQVVEAVELSKRAERQHEKSVALEGERGTIFDRKGRILATNVEVPSIYAIPTLIDNREAVASELARVLGTDSRTILKHLEGNRNFVWIERKVSPAVAESVKQLGMEGIGILNESQRFYPKRNLMGHLLGFAGMDNRGLEGIELKYDDLLRGEKGWAVVERDAFGQSIFEKGLNNIAPSRGKDLVLTIDEVIQHIAESELDAVMERTRAANGSVIVMNPKTGEVLAMAIRPEFNPNRVEGQRPAQWRNRAVTDPYEPGSTFKIVTASAALEEHVVNPNDVLYCEEGRMFVPGGVIRDHEKEGYLTFREVIQKSSNIGTIKVAMRIDQQRLYQYIRAFGFGEKTGIDLEGESAGMIKDPRSWSGRSLASIAIGQEVAATPIQIITAVSSIANKGGLIRPHLVSEIRDADGRVVATIPPEMKRRAVSPETAGKMMAILEGVVSKNGTGEKATIPGYRVAGKTGTAQKIDPVTKQYSMQDTVSSFIGIVPAEDPRIAVLVVVDDPKGVAWGGSIAAPVFKNVAEQVLRYLGIAPRTQERIVLTSAS
ncbi:MAG: penicillin-binding protein 2 [Nitrospirae bacterium]|nr:penicillin-binding protein 2 [Nitrospirota bacterium]